MLIDYMREWNAATSPTAQKVVESETKIKIVNGERVIVEQLQEATFQNVKCHLKFTLFKGHETLPPKSRDYKRRLIVPSTSKEVLLYPRNWASKAEKMMHILMAIRPGRDHEEHLLKLQQRAMVRMNKEIIDHYKDELVKTTYTPEEQDFLVQWVDKNTLTNTLSWNSCLFEILIKYHHQITGRGIIETGFNLGSEVAFHVKRSYGIAAEVINAANNSRNDFLYREIATKLFLSADPNKDPVARCYVRLAYSGMWDMCHDKSKVYGDSERLFVYVCRCIAAYYEKVTGISVEEECAFMTRKRNAHSDRVAKRTLNGTTKSQTEQLVDPSTPITTFGAEFGDVLSQAVGGKGQRRKKNGNKSRMTKDELEDKRFSDGGGNIPPRESATESVPKSAETPTAAVSETKEPPIEIEYPEEPPKTAPNPAEFESTQFTTPIPSPEVDKYISQSNVPKRYGEDKVSLPKDVAQTESEQTAPPTEETPVVNMPETEQDTTNEEVPADVKEKKEEDMHDTMTQPPLGIESKSNEEATDGNEPEVLPRKKTAPVVIIGTQETVGQMFGGNQAAVKESAEPLGTQQQEPPKSNINVDHPELT